ncbi:MAG: hypothetical protein ACR650_12740 [Methylocystis sp.]
MPIAVRPDSILQTMTAIRQMARYAKLAACRERPSFAGDMNAETELMGGSRYNFQHAEAFARTDVIRHLLPRAKRGLNNLEPVVNFLSRSSVFRFSAVGHGAC